MIRRTFYRIVLAFIGVAMASSLSLTARAADAQLTANDEIAIRGVVAAVSQDLRTIVVYSNEREYLTFRASDRVTNFEQIRPDMIVDLRYYRTMDFLLAKTTPDVEARANALTNRPARAPGIDGSQMLIGMWQVHGMVVKTDVVSNKIDIVDPSPTGGFVYRTPWFKTDADQATLRHLKPGDMITAVFSERTALQITPVR
jgi:hypothetical protein